MAEGISRNPDGSPSRDRPIMPVSSVLLQDFIQSLRRPREISYGNIAGRLVLAGSLFTSVLVSADFVQPQVVNGSQDVIEVESEVSEDEVDSEVLDVVVPVVPRGSATAAAEGVIRAPGVVILADNMDNPEVGFLPFTGGPGSVMGYGNGEYRIRNETVTGSFVGFSLPGRNHRDTSVAFDVRVPSGPNNGGVLVGCRRLPGQGYNFIFMPGNGSPGTGRFRVLQLGENRNNVELAANQRHPAILTRGQKNRIEVSCVGTTLAASVNGTTIFSANNGAYSEGGWNIGSVRSGTDAYLDNFVFTQR